MDLNFRQGMTDRSRSEQKDEGCVQRTAKARINNGGL